MVKLLCKKLYRYPQLKTTVNQLIHMAFIKRFNYHGNQSKFVCLDHNFRSFTKHNKVIQKINWFLLIEKNYFSN